MTLDMTPRNALFRAFLYVGTLAACSAAHAQDFGEWRALTAEEEQARIADVPSDSIDPAMIEGDFDGDGTKDKAMIAIRRSDQVRGLIVSLKGRIHVVEAENVEANDGLGLAEPGRWDTVCGNAFREFHQTECRAGYPAQVRLRNPGFLHIGQGHTVLYFWNPRKKLFDAASMVH